MVDKLRSLRSLSNSDGDPGEVLGIFTKEPVPGRVKTRLCPPLNPIQAAVLFRASLVETVSTFQDAGNRVVLFYSGDEAFFRRKFPGLSLVPQGDGDLGDRMAGALKLLLGKGFRAAALIGSDSPDLPPALVREAFAGLRESPAVAVPARDGGYVLIGETRHCDDLFRNVPWSGPRVLEVTRQRAIAAGMGLREVGEWDDVDDVASLRRLIRRSPRSKTARLAERLMARASRNDPLKGLETG